MAIFRVVVLLLLLLAFVLLLAPLQWLARRRQWSLARLLPIAFSRSLCWALQIRPVLHGQQSPARPQLVVSNHVSWTDIMVLGYHKSQSFLAKREVGGWPVFGMLARLQGTVFVDRTRRRGIPEVNRQMARSMQQGHCVVLFAEATTSDGTRIKRFHSSHFAAARDLLAMDLSLDQVTIQPATIVYTRENGVPLGRSGRSTVAWYGAMTLLPHVWRLLSGGPVDCQIVFGPPLTFTRGADRKQVCQNAEVMVRAAATQALSGRLLQAQVPKPAIETPVPILLQAETA